MSDDAHYDPDEAQEFAAALQAAVPSERPDGISILTRHMANMELLDPNVMRAVSTHSGISTLARASFSPHGFGTSSVARHHHHLRCSFVTTEFDQFWSHSWHGSLWKKLLLVVAMKNGPAAMLAGTFAGLVPMVLFITGYLPGTPRPALVGIDRGFLLLACC